MKSSQLESEFNALSLSMCSQNYFSNLKLIHREPIFNETKNDVCTDHFIQFIFVSSLKLCEFKFFSILVFRAKLALQNPQSALLCVSHCKPSGSVTFEIRKIAKNGYCEKCLYLLIIFSSTLFQTMIL